MYLSREEELLLAGQKGETLRKLMEILVALGEIYGADRLIPIRSVQVAGVSFKNIGQAGLAWISDLKGRAVVPSILNPAGMDLQRWREMGIDPDFAKDQEKVVEAYRRLGISDDCTCIPYQVRPGIAAQGDHLAWSESSAVSYANSVLGARTNREGGPSALASALLGRTPLCGYHLDENRRPTHIVAVEQELRGSDYGALGFLAGMIVKDGVPLFRLRDKPTLDELKALGASMAASGSVALYYVDGATPAPPGGEPEEKISFDNKDIEEVRADHPPEDADLVALGCPHCSPAELFRIADLLEGKKVRRELWICTARKIAQAYPDVVRRIEKSGARVICDTCMVVCPASERYRKIAVNSGKALAYIPGLVRVQAGFGSTEECIDVATRG
jgi:predicted aconitase